MTTRRLTIALGTLAALAASAPADATLFMEPNIYIAPGTGPGPMSFPLYDPEFLNGATGEPFVLADEPGEIVTYAAGVPVGADLYEFSIWNNTNYVITSLTFKIVGYAEEPEPYTFYIFRDPDVDAFFGDVDGDGRTGLSNIFPISTITDGGKTLTLSGGEIPLRGRFYDALLADTTDGVPYLAAIDSSFGGYLAVPEPASWAMMIAGFGLTGVVMRRRRTLAVAA
jgi:hypothetical protein